jgi:hypothetical protein
MDAESFVTIKTKVILKKNTIFRININLIYFRMDELLPHKANITYSDLVVLPDDNDMDVQTDSNSEVSPPPIRYYFNS